MEEAGVVVVSIGGASGKYYVVALGALNRGYDLSGAGNLSSLGIHATHAGIEVTQIEVVVVIVIDIAQREDGRGGGRGRGHLGEEQVDLATVVQVGYFDAVRMAVGVQQRLAEGGYSIVEQVVMDGIGGLTYYNCEQKEIQ